MSFYWIKTNRIVKTLFPNYVWDIPNREKNVYLTFDDGPTPQVTDWTLTQLAQFDAKATFFCIGRNIEENPDIFERVVEQGHAIGNHTFNHLNGWETSNKGYLSNVSSCQDAISAQTNHKVTAFRPPYGKIKRSQAHALRKMGYQIVMWDVLSADFDLKVTPEKCLQNVLKNVEAGSVIVFHDSVKAFRNLQYALPETLAFLKERGFKFEVIR